MIYEMLSSAFEKNRAERARYFSMLKAAAEQPGGQAAQPPKQPGGQNAPPPNQPGGQNAPPPNAQPQGGQGTPPPATQPPTGQGVQPPGAQPTAGQGVQQPGAQAQTVQMPQAMRPSVMWHQQRAAEEAAKQKERAAARIAGQRQFQQLAQNLNSNDPKERENARRQYVEAARNAGYGGYFEDYPGVSVDPEKWLDASKQVGYLVAAAQRASSQGDHSLSMALNKLEKKYRELAYRGQLPTSGTKPPSFNTYLKQLVYEGKLEDALASVGYTPEDSERLMNLLAGSTSEEQAAAAERTRREAEQRARARGEPVRVGWSYRPTARGAPADVMPGESGAESTYVQKPATPPPQAQAGVFRERRPPPAPGSTAAGRSAYELPADARFGYQQAGSPAPQHPGGLMGRSASELSINEKNHILSNINISIPTRNKVNKLISGSTYVRNNPNARAAAENEIRADLRNRLIGAITKGDEFDFNAVATLYGMPASKEEIDAVNNEVRRAVHIAQKRLGIKHERAATPANIRIDPSELLPSERKAILNSIELPAPVEGLIDVSPHGRELARQLVLNRMLPTITRGDRFNVNEMIRDLKISASPDDIAAANAALAQTIREARNEFLSKRLRNTEKPHTPTHSSVGKRMHELLEEEYKGILDQVNVPEDITADLNNLISRSGDPRVNKEMVQNAVNLMVVESVMKGTDFDIKDVLGNLATDEETARINNAYRKAIADAREELGFAPATPRTRTAGGVPGGTPPRRGEAQPPGGRPTETEPPIWWRRPQAPTPSPADLANRSAEELSEDARGHVLKSLVIPEDVRRVMEEVLARHTDKREGGITRDLRNMLINAVTRGETFDIGKLTSDYSIDVSREEIDTINEGFNQAIADARKDLGLVPSTGRETRPWGSMPFRLLPPDRLLPPRKSRLPPVTLT